MLVEFGKAGWIAKARQQPDKVKMVLAKVRTDGLAATIEAVQSKLDQPLPLGYCNVGVISDIGKGVANFAAGERVVSNGKHAEVVCVPSNLCARIPNGVSDQQASFTVLAAVGLQGIRLVQPTLGECVVVVGLGLIGLLTVQMLRAHGCRVMGIDLDPTRLYLARQFGAEIAIDPGSGEDVSSMAMRFSRGRGVDAVLITASTSSSEPVSQAARMCRKRGRIVLVGVTGLELSRADFYEKELSFQVSCSYGPGRYDPAYEEVGHDYPVGFVRWTAQRNFEAVLDMLAAGSLKVDALISHRFPLQEAEHAYKTLASGSLPLGILLEYPRGNMERLQARSVPVSSTSEQQVRLPPAGAPQVAFIGAGNYAGRVLIPAFAKAGAKLHTVVSAGGVSAAHLGRKYSFTGASTDWEATLRDTSINAVVVATRHDAHGRQVLAGLAAGKHVFCEKPLCLTLDELAEIEATARSRPNQLLMVGFNRRFSPHVRRIKQLLHGVNEPKSLIMTVNAGAIPGEHWTQDKVVGGGRIIGEACHFFDLLRDLVGAPIVRQHAVALGRRSESDIVDDKVNVTLEFADGSVGTVHYLANGNKSFPKERIEVFCGGRILQLDNFRRLRGWGWKGFSSMNLWRQDKGHAECVQAFVLAIKEGGIAPIALPEILEVSKVTIEIAQALETATC